MMVPFTSIGLVAIFSSLVQAYVIPASNISEHPPCVESHSTFTNSLDGWILERGSTANNYEHSADGLVMKITAPNEYVRLNDNSTAENLPYNKYEGKGFTFNGTSYMQYGRFSATVKSADVPGAVTAVILIADDGDEIDFELLAGGSETITSNYFWGKKIVYGANGRTRDPPAKPTWEQFYTYTIDWSPERIIWYIDGVEIRRTTKAEAGVAYPSSAARVQIGLWDGSGVSGTAQWARGPIDWKARNNKDIRAYVKDVTIECSSKDN
ncbi:concanavalin A-like lectin/glucanase domain-containing protein [Thamnidium elegans]|nr:concanavalin A-like lectin/glucanase domain-containing protein [Thamnidium elegans]